MHSFASGAGNTGGQNFLPATSPSLRTLFTQFQLRYPTASLVAELLMINQEHYVVRALVQLEGETLVSGMAAAADLELAEDRAKVRVLEMLVLQSDSAIEPLIAAQTATEFLPPLPKSTVLDRPPEIDLPEFGSIASPVNLVPDLLVPNLKESMGSSNLAIAEFSPELPSFGADSQNLDTISPVDPHAELGASVHSTTDLSDVIAQTTVELKRLGWSTAKGRTHLEQTYGKRSRQQLTDAELLDFLSYLESQPSLSQTPF
jgi:hypothetical protein